MITRLSLFALIISLTLINCQRENKSIANNSNDIEGKEIPSMVNKTTANIADFPPILDPIKNQLSKLDELMIFELNKDSDDNLDKQLLKLDSNHVDYFYSTKELKEYYNYFGFNSYFYGYNHCSNGLLRVYIINSNWETAIYLDCFHINNRGEITGNFRPSYIKMQPSYSLFGFGSYENDSTYRLTSIDYKTLDFINYKASKDSTTITYSISETGEINQSIEKHGIDTIYIVRE